MYFWNGIMWTLINLLLTLDKRSIVKQGTLDYFCLFWMNPTRVWNWQSRRVRLYSMVNTNWQLPLPLNQIFSYHISIWFSRVNLQHLSFTSSVIYIICHLHTCNTYANKLLWPFVTKCWIFLLCLCESWISTFSPKTAA